MKKAVAAIILAVLALFLVKNCAVWTYEATVSGHNAPITVRVSMFCYIIYIFLTRGTDLRVI